MKELFPYFGKPIFVSKEMCDHNGHMNTGSYTKCFDDCWGQMYEDMGFNDDYFNSGFSTFTLEENLKYFSEFLEGDYIYPSFRIVGLNRKCIHILGCLLDSKNNISTVYETVLGHIDMNLRKISEMDDSFFKSITSLKHSHDNLGNIPFDLRLVVKESV